MRVLIQVLSFSFLISTFVIFQNCGDSPVSRPNRLGSTSVGMGSVSPALAIRGMACMTCHAKIYGDVVTDFGYGSSYFFGLDKKTSRINENDYGPFNSRHGHFGGSWGSAAIWGDIYVPKVTLTDPRILEAYNDPAAGNTPVTVLPLVKFVTSKFKDPAGYVSDFTRKVPKGDSRYFDTTYSGLRGRAYQKNTIYIGAPTEMEIESLARMTGTKREISVLGLTVTSADSSVRLSNLVAHQGKMSRQFYLTNDGPIVCAGDVIVEGTLFLNNVVIRSDSGGCRFYVTNSVFIQGPITFQDSHPDANLQITSARAIIMGTRALTSRLTDEFTPHVTQGIRQAPTDVQELAWNQKIFEDRDKLDDLTNDAGPYNVRRLIDTSKTPPLGEVIAVMDDFEKKDWEYLPGQPKETDCHWDPAQAVKEGKKCVVTWAEGFRRKSIHFKHILLNAPKVHGRYHGVFEGVVIAEDGLFGVDHFEFRFDPLFKRVPILPLVGDRILSVTQ